MADVTHVLVDGKRYRKDGGDWWGEHDGGTEWHPTDHPSEGPLLDAIATVTAERDAAKRAAREEGARRFGDIVAFTSRALRAERAIATLRNLDEQLLEAAGQAYIDARHEAQGLPYAPVNTNGLIAMRAALRTAVDTATREQPDLPRLHPATTALVYQFAHAMMEKLAAAERKYNYRDEWQRHDWMDECRAKLREHVEKGDPLDVAAYCAFLWWHVESTRGAVATEAANG